MLLLALLGRDLRDRLERRPYIGDGEERERVGDRGGGGGVDVVLVLELAKK